MSSTLVFFDTALEDLRARIFDPSLESAAMLLCVPVRLASRNGWRLLVREVHTPEGKDYEVRTPTRVQLKTEYCLPIEKKARVNGWSLVYVHTHPQQSTPAFSDVDDEMEANLQRYLILRCPNVPHGSLLLGKDRLIAREIGNSHPLRVVELGADILVAYERGSGELLEERFDRQVRAFGPEGQRRLAEMTVAVIGLGGTGSHVVQQLAHLGVRRFILVDPDRVEATNLNRLVGARAEDIGSPKTDYTKRLLAGLGAASPMVFEADVTYENVVRSVVEADLVFNCTDTQASRHTLNQAAYQYGVPVIDMGVSVTVDESMRARLAGRVKMLSPGLPCLWCTNDLDAEQLRRELMTEEQTSLDPYVQGAATVPQPAVVSLNGTVASVAVTMFLSAVCGVPSPARYIHYDGNRSRMNGVAAQRDPLCAFCGVASTTGLGDAYPLPVRRSEQGTKH